jgi:spore germination protein YaaH
VSLDRLPASRLVRAVAIVATVVGASLPPVGAAVAADPEPADLQPSVHYEEALAHADDEIAFEPGGRVTVPFTPKADDTAPVGGGGPVRLPAGRATGRQVAATAQGEAWAEVPGTPPPKLAKPSASVAAPPSASPGGVETQAVSGLRREVFGFLPYWELPESTTVLDYDVLSTIAYFGVGADRYGNLIKQDSAGNTTVGWSGWSSSKLTSIINAAHARGTRVVLTVQMFAWTTSQATAQRTFLSNPSARLTLARQAAAAVRDRGADGINLDFEPIVSGYADEYTAFVRTVRTELDRIARGYQLTFDTTGYIGNYPVAEATAPGGADAIFVMGYDYRTSSASRAGSVAPLSGPAYDVTDTVDAYLARVPASKLILGVPYYGRAWSTESDVPNARTLSSAKYGASSAVVYGSAIDYANQYGRRYDTVEQSAWTAYHRQHCTSTYGCVNPWRELYFDDVQSLKAKYDLVNARGLRGVGLWALGYEGTRPELYAALRAKFIDDTTPPVAGITALPAVVTSDRFTVAWTGRDDVGISSWDVQVSTDGGPWTAWRTGTTLTSDVFVGSGGHRYAFRVRARDLRGNWSAYLAAPTGNAGSSLAVGGFARVVTDDLSIRAAPDTSATKLGELDSGALLHLTGGPTSADGYTWYEVTAPLASWGPVAPVQTGVWMAAGSGGTPWYVPAHPPNTIRVSLPVSDFRPAVRSFSPNGDGIRDVLRLDWTNTAALSSLRLRVLRPDGSLVGERTLSALAAGPKSTTWDGTIGGAALADGAYYLQLAGSQGSTTFAVPGLVGQATGDLASLGVSIDRRLDHTYRPLTPARVLDTRIGTGLSGPFVSRTPRTVQITGRGGVPVGATAVTLNLTVVGQTGSGYVSLTPSPTAAPSTSTINVPVGDIRANGVTTRLGPGGKLSAVYVSGSGARTHLLIDVTGYFLAGSGGQTYVPLTPARVLDTRVGTGLSGPFVSRTPRTVQITGRGGVPVGATAVTLNLTVVGQTGSGYVSLTPSPTAAPSTSTINVPVGDIRANGVTTRLGPGGKLSAVYISGSGARTHLLIDVTGFVR